MSITVTVTGDNATEVLMELRGLTASFASESPAAEASKPTKPPKPPKADAVKTEAAAEPAKPTHTIEEIRLLGSQFDTDEMRDAAVAIIGPACGENPKKSMSNILPANFDSVFDALSVKLKEFKAALMD